MKIIFLDVDGVLITGALGFKTPEPQAIYQLNRIVKETGAEIVLSSCWRVGRKRVECQELLNSWGVEAVVRDRTAGTLLRRGFEIQQWLTAFKAENIQHEVESFVIIDDDADMEHLCDHLVQTNGRYGLTPPMADLAIVMLNATARGNNPEQWVAELEAAGWKQYMSSVWQSPTGLLFRGPYKAWQIMKYTQCGIR